MSSNNKTPKRPIDKGERVIQRFGGIRPMSKKIGVPVTTIQGWKKRDTIPANRRSTIMKAAEEHGIDLSDLVAGAPPAKPAPTGDNTRTQAQTAEAEQKAASKAPRFEDDKPRLSASSENANAIEYAIQQAKSSAMKTNTIAAVVIILVLSTVFVLFLWPTKKQVDNYEHTITELEKEVKTVKKDHSMLKKIIPPNIKQEFEDLKTQAKDIKEQVGVIAEQTRSFAHLARTMLNPENGELFLRLGAVEEELGGVAGASDLSTLLRRVDELQHSMEGQEQLSKSVTDLNKLFKNFTDKQAAEEAGQEVAEGASVEEAIDEARGESEQLNETFAGVPKTDLKAAAYLLALSKFRKSLHRDETPFGEDLELLDKLAGDDPELKAAIERLAPEAEKGVLTPEGLSGEFKGLAGDIVVSSLKGEDIKLKDKATARLNDMVTIKKDGEQITGTETQIKVAKAQELLDQGDVQGAMAILQTLDGEAAETAAPFMEKAETTLDAQNLEQLLTGKLLENLKSGKFSFTPRALEDLADDLGEDAGLDVDSLGKPGDLESMLKSLGHSAPGEKKGSMGNRFRNITTKGKNLTQGLNGQDLLDGAKDALPSRKLYMDDDSGFKILAPTQDKVDALGGDKLGVDPKRFLEGALGGKSNKPVYLPEGTTKTPQRTAPEQNGDNQAE